MSNYLRDETRRYADIDHAFELAQRYARRYGLPHEQGFSNDFGSYGWSRWYDRNRKVGIQLEWRDTDTRTFATLHLYSFS